METIKDDPDNCEKFFGLIRELTEDERISQREAADMIAELFRIEKCLPGASQLLMMTLDLWSSWRRNSPQEEAYRNILRSHIGNII